MAIITSIFNKLQQLISTYIFGGSPSWLVLNRKYIYFMPILYLSIFATAVALVYFIWKKYQLELQDANISALQSNSKLPPYTWLNRLANWTFMTDSHLKQPECIKRWIEELNIAIVKQKSEISVLLYDICEESYPPRVKDIGMVVHRSDGVMEIPVLIESCQFGFQVSVQEHIGGKVVASSYQANVTKFYYMIIAHMSRENGDVIARFRPDLSFAKNEFQIKLHGVSKQRVVSTIPETVANIIKDAVLTTPFQLNVSNWGGVFSLLNAPKNPETFQKKEVTNMENGDIIKESTPKAEQKPIQIAAPKEKKHEINNDPPKRTDEKPKRKKSQHKKDQNKNVTGTKLPASFFLEHNLPSHIQDHGLSGSLGSLVNVKRSNSGRGPAKPIRANEKQIIFREITVSLEKQEMEKLDKELFCMTIELDLPFQKLTTKSKPLSSLNWDDKNLVFDLSSRSMEIKFTLSCMHVNKQPLLSTTGIFKLEGIDVHKPGEFKIPLQNNMGMLIVKVEFLEADVVLKAKDRRSLDLSTLSRYQPQNFKENIVEVPQKRSDGNESPPVIPSPVDEKQGNEEKSDSPKPKEATPDDSTKTIVDHFNEKQTKESPDPAQNTIITVNDKPPLSPRERAQTESNEGVVKTPMREDLKQGSRVRRTRSLIFGKGKKKDHHSQSAMDLSHFSNDSEGAVNDEDIGVPENTLQKKAKSKKKVSRSVSKLVSKIARKTSVKKKKGEAADVEDEVKEVVPMNQSSNNGNGLLTVSPAKSDTSSSSYPDSINSSTTDSPSGSVKRSRSFRHRLFGAKRKTDKN